ncbi:hypothetical protein [Azospirillum doebereinerae]|uniref:Uncharacterized protein n=1 Tax=Azospirillum doebereinerae TaxID=92933 RepID=A0A3S0X8H1_9PROT|nr:hypothetical protein [Azospirillum doebereinerae]RUQ66166.1 hypothetical protein EJ913_23225 [Azospirillum doebereinerae]
MNDHGTLNDHESLGSVRLRALEKGQRLGLPREWLRRLPGDEPAPGAGPLQRRGMDRFLAWKRQEMLARHGRMNELSPELVAEALEEVATSDGPRRARDASERIMFALAWPKRTPGMRVHLLAAAEDLRNCLRESPSMPLFTDLPGYWRATQDAVLRLDDTVRLRDDCPWPSLQALLRDAEHAARHMPEPAA